MGKQAIFYFDVGSPATYLAYRALPAIAAAAGADIVWVPVLLGGVFRSAGNLAPGTVPAKSRWMWRDLQLWARRRGTTLQQNPGFPVNTVTVQRGAVAYQDSPLFARYLETMFTAMWEVPKDLGDPAILDATLRDAGFDVDDFRTRVGMQSVKDQLRANTEAAVAAGVFGCPTIIVGDMLFFGQDRLDFVAEALAAE